MRAASESNRAGGASLGANLSEPIETIKEDLGQLGHDVADAGRAVVETGREAITGTARKLGGQAKNLHEKLCDITTSRPTTSLLVAMGVGAVLGLLLFRKR